MTLGEWIELSANERNAHRRNWKPDRGDWTILLAQAEARFQTRYRSHPLINYISRSGWHDSSHEPSILVTTALHSPQLIEELPDRFCTFRVVQEQVLDNRDHYLRYWTLLFNELLGWSEAQTRQWAQKWDAELNGRTASLFYHEDPYYYVLPHVIRESVPADRLVGPRSTQLYNDVLETFRSHGSEPIWLSPYDWDAARDRINAILTEVAGRLPR